MTHRLYYDQSYLTEFDARITRISLRDGQTWAAFDQSAFYPTSGGQPYDTGTITVDGNTLQVLEVLVDDEGILWHRLSAPVCEGALLHGCIDWPRRFDHMQQHGGEHMLAGALWRNLGGMTIGLHLGAQTSSIDADMPQGRTHLTEEEILLLEEDVNSRIQRNVPIRCWFPSPEELETLPLRKAPTVKEHVRVVAIGDDEMVACGGTHPSCAGQIGLVKILSALPARGKLRLTFVCGMRAYRYFQQVAACAEKAAVLLSCPVAELPQAVERQMEKTETLFGQLREHRRQAAVSAARQALSESLPLSNGVRIVSLCIQGAEMDALRQAASLLIETPNVAALLAGVNENGCLLLFARGKDVSADMGRLIRLCGGKGGGKPDFAQGSAPDASVLRTAEEALRS